MLTWYQIQHANQDDVALDIDHPSPSPEPSVQGSNLSQSPPYNSHIPTTIRAPKLASQTWSSPAFLKRSHLSTSTYDPFAEADFPDNDRRKKTKFGRGSSEWKYSERTPSPEKEGDTATLDAHNASDVEEPERMIGITSPSPAQTLPRETTNDQTAREVTAEEASDGAAVGLPSPPTASAEPPESPPEDSVPKESSPVVQYISSASSQHTSSPVISGSEQHEIMQDVEDYPPADSDAGMFSGRAPDFGLDGSALSRVDETSKSTDKPEEYVDEAEDRRSAEVVLTTVHHMETSVTEEVVPSSGPGQMAGDYPSTIQESMHGFMVFNGDDSEQAPDMLGERAAQKIDQISALEFSEPLESEQPWGESVMNDAVASEKGSLRLTIDKASLEDRDRTILDNALDTKATQLERASNEEWISKYDKESQEEDSDEEDVQDEIESEEEYSEDDEGSEDGYSQGEESSHEEELQNGQIPDKAGLEEPYKEGQEGDSDGEDFQDEIKSEEEYIEDDEGTEDGYSQDEQGSQEEQLQNGQTFEETTQEHKAGLEEPLEPEKSAVEIIDLESNDEDEQSAQPRSPAAVTSEPIITDSDQIDSGPSQADSAAMPQQETSPSHEQAPESVVAESDHIASGPLQADSPTILQKGVSSSSEEEAPRSRLSSPAVAAETRKVTLQPAKTEQEPLFAQPTSSSQTPKAAQSPPLEELPSTVRDTYDEPSSKSQLVTPSDTQQSSFVSQPSFPSMATLPGADTLPTPRLTQGTSAGIVPPELLSQPASQEPLQTQPWMAQEETKATETKPSTPQRAPNLIDKLKAMRKLSSQSSRRSSDVSATSPWFAPARPSQIVPDSEAESEVESLPGNDRSFMQEVTAVGQRTERRKPSANAFLASPARSTTAAPMASSPGYLPPSQPPPPGFRTNLSYFVPLATLLEHFTTTVDVLAIAVSSTPVIRATSGPKDFTQTLYLTDPSSSTLQTPIRSAQIFRSYNKCFPICEKGDAVMLRDFRVQSFQRQMTLLSTQSSSWAVFRKGHGVQVRGPPIEFGAEERLFARGMWRWWDGLKEEERAALEEAVPKEEPKTAKTKGNKTNGLTRTPDKAQNADNTKPKIKKEALEGLGIELPGSQSKARRASISERSMGLDGTSDSDKAMESTEPPRRVLRPRGARGLPEKSESPAKAWDTRSGSVFTGGLGEPDSD